MKFRSWLTSDKEEQAEEPVEVGGLELDGDGEVLESGFDLEDFEEDIEGREDTIDQLEREVDRHQKKKRKAVEKAEKARKESDQRSEMMEAKEHKIAGEKKEKILNHLRSEKLTLVQLKLQHLQNNLGSGLVEDVDIDLGELDVSSIEDAIQEGEDELWEASENMDELDETMKLADEELSGVDLDEIRDEVDGSSNNEIDVSLSENPTDEEIDQAINQTLDQMDENL